VHFIQAIRNHLLLNDWVPPNGGAREIQHCRFSARENSHRKRKRNRKCRNGGCRVHSITRRLLCFNIPLGLFRILY